MSPGCNSTTPVNGNLIALVDEGVGGQNVRSIRNHTHEVAAG